MDILVPRFKAQLESLPLGSLPEDKQPHSQPNTMFLSTSYTSVSESEVRRLWASTWSSCLKGLFPGPTPDLLNQDLWGWSIGICTCTPGDSNDEKHSPRGKLIPSGRMLSDSSFFHLSPCQSQHPGVARTRSRRGTRAGLTAPPGGDQEDQGEESRSASRWPGSPGDRSRDLPRAAESQGLEPVGPRGDLHVRTALLPLVDTRPSLGYPGFGTWHARLRAAGDGSLRERGVKSTECEQIFGDPGSP